MLAAFQGQDRGGFQQERLTISKEDALKRAQELFEKKGGEVPGSVGMAGVFLGGCASKAIIPGGVWKH